MGSYVVRVKVLPADPATDLEKIVESIKKNLGAKGLVKSETVEPIAFGLSAVILDIVAPESEGSIERVEKSVSSVPLVGQYEVVGVSRMSSRLPPR